MGEIAPLQKQGRSRRTNPSVRIELILDEALQLFAERNYLSVTTRDVAEACGVNVALIYYYFDSKEQLFLRTIEHVHNRLRLDFDRQRQRGLDPLAEINAYFDAVAEIAPAFERWDKILSDYTASEANNPQTDDLIADFFAHEQAAIRHAIGRGVASGEFRRLDPDRAARMISVHLDGIFHAIARRRDGHFTDDMENLKDMVAVYLSGGVGR